MSRVGGGPPLAGGSPGSVRVDSRGSGSSLGGDPVLAFYPSSHARARLPETVQSRSGHVGCGTFSVSVARGDPSQSVHTPRVRRVARGDYATFTIASAGTTPVVAYRHSAITNRRATATMPMRRKRLLPPKRSRYQRVSGLPRCQRTQFHAS